MVVQIDRRSLILGGGLGLGALTLPAGRALAAEILGAKGFTHNVASGEPGADSMLLWTRYVPAIGDNQVRLDVEVAREPDFAKVLSGASVRTGAYRDWTAKVTVDGLQPGTVYWYRFIAPDGSKSPVGRTKTLPVGDTARFGLGVFSCSNLPTGWFNAYGHAAARPDLDLWLHVGDYIYEYGTASYHEELIAGRALEPDHRDAADVRRPPRPHRAGDRAGAGARGLGALRPLRRLHARLPGRRRRRARGADRGAGG